MNGWTAVLVVVMDVAAMTYATGVLRLWQHACVGEGISPRQVISFVAGLAALFVAIVWPLTPGIERMHDELLVLLAAPLIVHGRPIVAFQWALRRRVV